MKLINEESAVKKDVKQKKETLHLKTKRVIEELSENEALKIVEAKWILPLLLDIDAISDSIVIDMVNALVDLSEKYKTTLNELQNDKKSVSYGLSNMLSLLKADGSDEEGLMAFRSILGGMDQ